MKKILTLLGILAVVIIGYYFISDRSGNLVDASKMSFFITSVNPGKGGDLGGLAGADAYCSKLAGYVGSKGKTWKAYLSTTGENKVNARDRIGSGPWYNAKGIQIAQSIDSLHGENNITKETALNEKGETVMGRGDVKNLHDILTGSDAMGYASTTATGDTTCANWTSSSVGSALVGHHDRIGLNDSAPMKSWNSSHGTRGCDMPALESTGGAGLFYCFVE